MFLLQNQKSINLLIFFPDSLQIYCKFTVNSILLINNFLQLKTDFLVLSLFIT